MEPPINCPIEKHWRLNDIQKEVTNVFKKYQDKIELFVVILPDKPAGVYGNKELTNN